MKFSVKNLAVKGKIVVFALTLSVSSIAGMLPVSQASAACAALPTDKGTATTKITVPTDGTYRVWSRIMAPDTTNNSYLLQIDDTTCGVVVGDSAIPANSWTWVDYSGGNTASKINVNLTAGTHTVMMAGREAGVKLDRVEFAADTSCVPTGTGDNCATVPDPNAKPDLVITAITPTAAKTGDAVKLSATVKNQGSVATPAGTVIGASFRIDGAVVSWSDTTTSSLAPGATVTLTANSGPSNSATWAAVSGAHSVEAWVDDVDRIPETNEANNKLSTTITITDNTQTPPTTTPPTPPTTPTTVVGDANGDKHVNTLDLSLLLAHDGQNYQPADFNHDGTIGAADLAILLSHWTW